MRFSILAIAGVLLSAPFTASAAASCTWDVTVASVTSVPSAPLAGKAMKLYTTLTPDCPVDTEGIVRYTMDGSFLGSKSFSVKANGKPEEVWMAWMTQSNGDHTLAIEVLEDDGISVGRVTKTIFVDRDTDGDGIPDATDPDDDGDGVPDAQDQFPLDPTRSKDTDGDGTDDKTDSDQDNDGLFNFEEQKLGTNPLKRDTDGDLVGDKQDAFPLDPKRSAAPTPEPTPAPPETAAPAVESPNSEPVAKTEPVKTDLLATNAEDLQIVEAAALYATATLDNSEPAPAEIAKTEDVQKEDKAFPTESQKLIAGLLLTAGIMAAGAFVLLSKAKKHEGGKK